MSHHAWWFWWLYPCLQHWCVQEHILALRCPRCFFRSESRTTQGSRAQGHQVANPPQQAAARKESKHTKGRKLPGCKKANMLLPPAACCCHAGPTFPRAHSWETSSGAWSMFGQLVGECGWRNRRGRSRPMPAETPSCALASQLLLRALLGTTPLPPSMAYGPPALSHRPCCLCMVLGKGQGNKN